MDISKDYARYQKYSIRRHKIKKDIDAGLTFDEAREKLYKVLYGMTIADYDKKLAEQNGVCAICGGINVKGHKLAIDHNHATGAIRGLLCRRCNLGLGYFKDSNKNLERAFLYLKNYK